VQVDLGLGVLGIEGHYVRNHLRAEDLPDFIASRRGDPHWRGCNVTIPHKQAVMPLLDRIDPAAEAIGAVNCVVPEAGGLAGYNSDIDGVAEALDSTAVEGRKVAVIGAGGGARAVISYLAGRGADIVVLARNPAKAGELRGLGRMTIQPLGEAAEAFEGAAAIINATSLGMAGADPMPKPLLAYVKRWRIIPTIPTTSPASSRSGPTSSVCSTPSAKLTRSPTYRQRAINI